MKHKIYGEELANMPFEPRPEGCASPLWRYSKNPIIDINPFKGAQRVFNSAVMPFNGEFVGAFRADTKTGVPYIFLGILAFVLFSRLNGGANNKAFEFGKSRARLEGDIRVRFTDVAGCDEEKEEMAELIVYLR